MIKETTYSMVQGPPQVQRPKTLPLLEEFLASLLQGQCLGKCWVVQHASLRNGAVS